MNIPRAIFFICLLVVGVDFFILIKSENRGTQIAEATEEQLQYAAVYIDRAGFRKVLSVGSLEECVQQQNVARSLNLDQGKEMHKVDCVPS